MLWGVNIDNFRFELDGRDDCLALFVYMYLNILVYVAQVLLT